MSLSHMAHPPTTMNGRVYLPSPAALSSESVCTLLRECIIIFLCGRGCGLQDCILSHDTILSSSSLDSANGEPRLSPLLAAAVKHLNLFSSESVCTLHYYISLQ